ncbi:MAG: uracil-DNA glycosylase [Phycisphaeraceae bacterium]
MNPHADWSQLNAQIINCTRCPRLVEHCQQIAQVKRKSFADWDYWGRPVPNFGDPDARLLIIGLAPAAHGANRTGRMFTGDRSGDFLYRALYETGLANQPTATHADDGLALHDIAITAAAHCAPPANKPTRDECDACFDYLPATVRALEHLKGIIVLGGIAMDTAVKLYREMDWSPMKPKPKFGHGKMYRYEAAPFLLCSYHPSQQNTFTGRLTADMLREVFVTAKQAVDVL